MKKILTGIASLMFSSFLIAELSYTNIGIGHRFSDGDVIDISGINLNGAIALSDSMFLLGSYTYGEDDDAPIDVTEVHFGLGIHAPMSEVTDFVASFEIIDRGIETQGQNDDLSGFLFGLGVRSQFSDTAEIQAKVSRVDAHVETLGVSIGVSDTIFSLGILFDVFDIFQFSTEVSVGDVDTLDLGFRINL